MTSLDKNKPCLVETSQGFSVKYNERFLYSKYNPENIIRNAQNYMPKIPQIPNIDIPKF